MMKTRKWGKKHNIMEWRYCKMLIQGLYKDIYNSGKE